MTLDIPERLIKAIIFARGQEDGEAWLRVLPRRVDHYLKRWQLQPLGVADGGSMSCCLFCLTPDGAEAVLKIPFDAASGRLESRSLNRWARAEASPAVLATAPSSGVFLMGRVRPGTTPVLTGDPSEAEHFCDLMSRMAHPALGPMRGLQTIETVTRMRFDWAYERFLDPGYEQELAQMRGVEQLLRLLTDTAGEPQVIHGDLQAKNILIGADGAWQAIDPFTCVGDLNAEAGLWVAIQRSGSIEDRLMQLSQGPMLSKGRLQAWTYICAVAEYRSYVPSMAARTRAFTADLDWREIASGIVTIAR